MAKFFKLIDLVNATPEIKWSYPQLNENANINPEDLQPEQISRHDLSNNPNLTFEYLANDISTNGEINEWIWYRLSENMPLSDIFSHPELPWNEIAVSGRITDINTILEHPKFEYDYGTLTQSLN